MQSRTLRKAVTFLLYLTVIGTPLFYFARGVYPYGVAKSLFFQSLVELLFFTWLALCIYEKRFRPSWTPLMKAFAVFGAVLILTAVTGVDFYRSFWSTQERAIGVFTMLHFLTFAVVLSSMSREIKIERLFYASLAASVLVSAIAFLQIFIPSILLNESVGSRPGSTFGNPAFLAGYLLLNIFISVYFVLRWLKQRHAKQAVRPKFAEFWVPALAGVINLAALFRTETRGDILGMGVGAIALLTLFTFRPPVDAGFWSRRKNFALITIIIVLFGGAFWLSRGSDIWSAVPGLSRFRDVSVSSETLMPRIIALNAAWKGFVDSPILGWGWDNFNIVFNKYYDPRALESNYQETRFDKPHNFVFEYMVVGGMILTLAYAAIFAFLFYEARKLKDSLLGTIIIAGSIAYIARNFFVFETLGPLLMFFLFLGVTDGSFVREKSVAKEEPGRGVVPSYAVGIAVTTALILIYLVNWLTLQASHYQFLAYNLFLNTKPEVAIRYFRRAIGIWSPYAWNLKRDYAAAVAEAYFYNPELVTKEDALLAVNAMEQVSKEHPLDAYNHYALVDMYNQISDINPDSLLKAAENEAAIALELSPNRQEVMFSLAKTKTLQKKNNEALEILRKAIDLSPKVPDAHFYYGLIAYSLNDFKTGYEEIKKSIELGRRWKKYHEPRVVANFFANSGHLDEALELYSAALKMEPNDLEARAKLGVAYYIKGDLARAKENLEEVNRRFKFRESASFESMKPILDALGIIY